VLVSVVMHRASPSICSDICGEWEFESIRRGSLSKMHLGDMGLKILTANRQGIRWINNRLVFSSKKKKGETELSFSVGCNSVIDSSEGQEGHVRVEYKSDNHENEWQVVDERRVFRNGTRMEQTISVTPLDGETSVQVRVFKRAYEAANGWNSLSNECIFLVLLCLDIPVLLLSPWALASSFCVFHILVSVFFIRWRPRIDINRNIFPMDTSLPTCAALTQDLNLDKGIQVDVVKGRKKQRGFLAQMSFEIVVRENGRSRSMLKTYKSIFEFHKHVTNAVETDTSKKSLFTRIVPDIPPMSRYSSLVLTSSGRRVFDDRLERRLAALKEFFEAVFGMFDADLRNRALLDPNVKKFLQL